MRDNALSPLSVFQDTTEHARAISVLKSRYTLLTPAEQCLLLVHEYNKPFEYETDVFQIFEPCNEKNMWEACIWDPSNRVICDILINIHLITEHTGAARLVARNQRRGEEVILSDSESSEISMPLSGIPTIALQYCKLYVIYKDSKKPKGLKLRCRILPTEMRRVAAQLSHTSDKYFISMGEFMTKNPSCGCVVS